MNSISQFSYQMAAVHFGRVMALLCWCCLAPLGLVFGACQMGAQNMRKVVGNSLRWIGPAQGQAMGLCSTWRLHVRMALPLGDEVDCDQADAMQRGWRYDAALLVRYGASLLIGRAARQSDARWPLLNLWLDNLRQTEVIEQLQQWQGDGQFHRIAFVNPHCANLASQNPRYRGMLNAADLLLPDGSGVLLASRMLGTPLKENTNGTDLFPVLCRYWQQQKARVYLLGAHRGVAGRMAEQLLWEYPGLHIAGSQHGYFAEEDTPNIIQKIRDTHPDVLLVAMGVPKQDMWIAEHLAQLQTPVAMGVGGLFDFYSGRISRAPVWLREIGMEWSWRLIQEPRRMWQRYLVGNFTFLARVVRQRCRFAYSAHPVLSVPSVAAEHPDQVHGVLLAEMNVWPQQSEMSTLFLPLLGQTLLERTVIRMVEQGVQQLHVMVDLAHAGIEALLGQGSRWGIQIHYHLLGANQPLNKRLSHLPLAGSVWVVAPGCLPDEPLASDISAQWQLADGTWSGWALCLADIFRNPPSSSLALPNNALVFEGLGLRSPAEFLAAQAKLLKHEPNYVPGYAEEGRDIWLAPNVLIEEGAILQGPLLIGPDCIIRKGVELGPNCVLASGCVLDKEVSAENTLFLPDSLIGQGLLLKNCIVGRGQIYWVESKLNLQLAADDCLVQSLAAPIVKADFIERLQAALLWLWLGLQRRQLDPKRQHILSQRLKEVCLGTRHLIGLPEFDPNTNQEWLRTVQNLRLGALRLSELQIPMFPSPQISRDEQAYLLDLYGAAVPQRFHWSHLSHLRMSLIRTS
ncbi:WecB/TagA/CpsF family glycosyltransferase [Deefgea tanakiae]|uniref:WecB/TagA/CpsF family glycosyltransferase n=1 Tax=Deefgea tanakiae TaxID=2865840 RepID=A0ABX8ZAY3_9NEIS|nr:WecB/TagA/CpsF family glycosyltransferase [Deefgea tanakiae]QZA78950.1 WecB/TagA/CpsF family glycosyltransferase [Deefgea tanakiae]